MGSWAIQHRWRVAVASLGFLALGGWIMSQLKPQFFPKDLQYLSYVEIWLPEDAPLSATREVADRAEQVIQQPVAGVLRAPRLEAWRGGLVSLTTFLGGGGPRFWYSFAPEPRQSPLRAHRDGDPEQVGHARALTQELQETMSREIPGARVDVRELENGPAGRSARRHPAQRGPHADAPRPLREFMGILRRNPYAERVHEDWGSPSFAVDVAIDPDRANQAGLTNADVAVSTAVGLNGLEVTSMYRGDQIVPVIARLRMEERARLADLRNLYVYSSQGGQKVTLPQIASLSTELRPEQIKRRNQFRTVTVQAFPRAGALPSEVLAHSQKEIDHFAASLPPGFRLQIAGEYEKQQEGFGEMTLVLIISMALIFLALTVQFQNAIKPFIVFGAIPYGFVGAVAGLWVMGSPFGFMGFLGIASLVGVIVSHVIVLFDFIEEAREKGEGLEEALLDAGIQRLRPVMITVGATLFALVPLAMHGGPMWEPLCYAQIGGLAIATVITLLLVPVFYSIAVKDLKIVKWESPTRPRIRRRSPGTRRGLTPTTTNNEGEERTCPGSTEKSH